MQSLCTILSPVFAFHRKKMFKALKTNLFILLLVGPTALLLRMMGWQGFKDHELAAGMIVLYQGRC